MPDADGAMNSREYRKMQQRCVSCGQRDAYTMAGRAVCADCCEKRRDAYHLNSEPRKAAARDNYHRAHAARIDDGICVRCGKAPAADGHKACEKCLAKWRAVQKKDIAPGMCTRCHKREPMDGKRLCRECYDSSCAALAKAREISAAKNRTHVWRRRWKRSDTNAAT